MPALKLSLTSRPASIEDCDRRIATLQRELSAISRDQTTSGSTAAERIEQIETEIAGVGRISAAISKNNGRLNCAHVAEILDIREKLGVKADGAADKAPALEENAEAEPVDRPALLEARLKVKSIRTLISSAAESAGSL